MEMYSEDIKEKIQNSSSIQKDSVGANNKQKDTSVSSPSTIVVQTPKPKYTRADFIVSKLTGPDKEHVKIQFDDLYPFSIEDCKDASVFLLTPMAQCTVDACQDCFLFIGPSEGPVFLRDCSNCTVIVACQQLRLRDCKDIKIGLYCKGQPIIESSARIEFSCFTYFYPSLAEHFEKAKLPIFQNDWSNVYDFNPDANWTITNEPIDAPKVPLDSTLQCSSEKYSSSVPFTLSSSSNDHQSVSWDSPFCKIISFVSQVETSQFLVSNRIKTTGTRYLKSITDQDLANLEKRLSPDALSYYRNKNGSSLQLIIIQVDPTLSEIGNCFFPPGIFLHRLNLS